MARVSHALSETLSMAFGLAHSGYNQPTNSTHLLAALMDDPDASALLGTKVDIDALRRVAYTTMHAVKKPAFSPKDANRVHQTSMFRDIMQRGTVFADTFYDGNLNGAVLIHAMLEMQDCRPGEIVREHGLTLEDAESFLYEHRERTADDIARDREELRKAVPHQSPAPIRVEDRGGILARVSDGDARMGDAEGDFDRWREPVLDHLRELEDGDFRPGTNHGRVRDRLLALDHGFEGTVDEVLERQFRIGYDIERLGRLIAVYQTAKDDMPSLNAAVLDDLIHLHVQLMLGIGKLENWAKFQKAASDDPAQEGAADPEAVGAALESLATVMETGEQAGYFAPELPASFRFLTEAVRDPWGATKATVYGAVKSAENLLSFLGQTALSMAKDAADAAQKQIGKAVAATLLTSLGTAALQLSGALPTAWAWLKPLLEAVAKGVSG